jgi:long-subunit fatty acid transport protein
MRPKLAPIYDSPCTPPELKVCTSARIYPTAGAGASYEKVAALGGNDLKVGALALEASPALSVALLKNLSLGLGYRMSYVTQTADTVQSVPGPMGMPVPTTAEANLSGFNFTALSAGLYYEPAPKIALGFTYRSKMSADLSGTTSIGGGPGFDTKSSFETPHELRVGSAFWLADDRVMLALDFKYLLYSDMKTVDTTVTTPAGAQTSATTYDWHNVPVLGVGAEVLVHPKVPLRIGYSESGSATSSSYPSPFLPLRARCTRSTAASGSSWRPGTSTSARCTRTVGRTYRTRRRPGSPATTGSTRCTSPARRPITADLWRGCSHGTLTTFVMRQRPHDARGAT